MQGWYDIIAVGAALAVTSNGELAVNGYAEDGRCRDISSY